MSRHPSDDAIRRRAHEIWRRRGSAAGSPEGDWHQAERELRAEAARAELPTAPPPPAKRPPVSTRSGTPLPPPGPTPIARLAPPPFPAIPSSSAPPAGSASKPGKPPKPPKKKR